MVHFMVLSARAGTEDPVSTRLAGTQEFSGLRGNYAKHEHDGLEREPFRCSDGHQRVKSSTSQVAMASPVKEFVKELAYDADCEWLVHLFEFDFLV